MMRLTIVLTVYNEMETIAEAIEQVRKLPIEKQIVIIDNCSTDGTVEILKGLADPSIEICFQPENYGFGTSVAKGTSLAKGTYTYIHYTDLEYDPHCIFEMIELAEKENLDAVFGSRLLTRKNESMFKIVRERPFYLGTIITTFLTNLFYHRDFTDIIGAKFYRTEAFRALNPQNLKGIGFDWEVIGKLCKYGYKIKEIPVRYTPRTKGKKKIHAYDIVPAVLAMLKIKVFG
jgi:glycosyltransferase involved in cell wall biosynthesis